jgi:hypothetical protein
MSKSPDARTAFRRSHGPAGLVRILGAYTGWHFPRVKVGVRSCHGEFGGGPQSNTTLPEDCVPGRLRSLERSRRPGATVPYPGTAAEVRRRSRPMGTGACRLVGAPCHAPLSLVLLRRRRAAHSSSSGMRYRTPRPIL